MKYHINIHGEPSLCKAVVRECPREHFDSLRSAQDYVDQKNIDMYGVTRVVESPMKTFNKLDEQVIIAVQGLQKKEDAFNELAQRARGGDEKALRELQPAFNELREARLNDVYGLVSEREKFKYAMGLNTPSSSQRLISRLGLDDAVRDQRGLKVRFDALTSEGRNTIVQHLSAWSGESISNAGTLVDEALRSKDADERIVALFQDSIGKDDRDRVYYDIETTSFDPSQGDIIEIGVIRVNSQGIIVDQVNERFDMRDEDYRDAGGIGAVEVHNITPEEIKGKPVFSNPMIQDRLAGMLNDPNTVTVAHNAFFEHDWLSTHLNGFWEKHSNNSPEALIENNGVSTARHIDTVAISKYLFHGSNNNKLESFTTMNGIPYVNAHNGFEDSMMTKQALEGFVERMSAAPRGKRPEKISLEDFFNMQVRVNNSETIF